MLEKRQKMTIHDRVSAVLAGDRPDRIPFLDRMELWYQSKIQEDEIPDNYKGMSLDEVHQAVGMGRQKFTVPYAYKLHGVEVVYCFENEFISRDSEPVYEYFPAARAPDEVPRDRAGTTTIEFITAVGKLSLKYIYADSLMQMGGAEPYLAAHLIKEDKDYRTAEYIIERAEFVPLFEKIYEDQKLVGDNGFTVPWLHRVPFQQVLLEYLGEVPLFNALYDNPNRLDRLIEVLDQKLVENLHQLTELHVPYVEFPDNIDGMMTNPKLFRKYSLPYYQKYAEILHAQDKKMGSHTDGNLFPLLSLLAESGLDVCESFSPAPLTECPFIEAWNVWKNGPIIWGGIPSPILEERTSEGQFQEYVHSLFEVIGKRPIILGVGDMVLGNNLIERVRYIADEVEKKALDQSS